MPTSAKILYEYLQALRAMRAIGPSGQDGAPLAGAIAHIESGVLDLLDRTSHRTDVLTVAVTSLPAALLARFLERPTVEARLREAFARDLIDTRAPMVVLQGDGRLVDMVGMGYRPSATNMAATRLLHMAATSHHPAFFEAWACDKPRGNAVIAHAQDQKHLTLPETVPTHLIETWVKALPRLSTLTMGRILREQTERTPPSPVFWKFHVAAILSNSSIPFLWKRLSKEALEHPVLAPPTTAHQRIARQNEARSIPAILAMDVDTPLLGMTWQQALHPKTVVDILSRRAMDTTA